MPQQLTSASVAPQPMPMQRGVKTEARQPPAAFRQQPPPMKVCQLKLTSSEIFRTELVLS